MKLNYIKIAKWAGIKKTKIFEMKRVLDAGKEKEEEWTKKKKCVVIPFKR